MTDEDMVASFENHMRLFQQRRDLSAKERANAVNVKPDYCTWCFKNKGAKFNNHTEATCRNKKRAEVLAAVEATPRTAAAATPADPRTTSSKIVP